MDSLRSLLKGGAVVSAGWRLFTITRSLPHGAVLGMARAIGLDRVPWPRVHRCRDLVLAMIVNRVIAPASKLATVKALDPETVASSLGVDLGPVDEDELTTALDWPRERRAAIEPTLAKRHLQGDMLMRYDISSRYVEGRYYPLATRGYSRDAKKGKAQSVQGPP